MDARIPCPVCAQPIHPVAGRCKYCKTDLVKLREARGVRAPRVDVAAAAAPQVAQPFAMPAASAPVELPPVNGSNGHVLEPAHAPYPDLPVRTSLWRRWPILVAIIAGIAILVCAYLLLFDKQSASAAAKPSKRAPVAGDNMPQAPLPDPGVPTPSPGGGGHLPDPWADPGAQGTAPQLPPDFDDPPQPGDPVPAPNPAPSAPTLGGVPAAEDFYAEMQDRSMKAFSNCLGGGSAGSGSFGIDLNGLGLGNLANGYADQMREAVRQGRCTYDEAKAKKCLDMIDGFQCKNGQLPDLANLDLSSLMACGDALTCH